MRCPTVDLPRRGCEFIYCDKCHSYYSEIWLLICETWPSGFNVMLLRYSSESNCYDDFLLVCPNNAHEELFGDFILISPGDSSKSNSHCDTSLCCGVTKWWSFERNNETCKIYPILFYCSDYDTFHCLWCHSEVESIGLAIRVDLICYICLLYQFILTTHN